MHILAVIAAFALAVPAAAAQDPAFRDAQFRVADIEARLLYEASGALSADMSADPEFAGWNTIIGEGSALEPANDLLVTAVIHGPGEHNLGTPLILTARDARGRVLGRRRIPQMLAGARTYRSLLLQDVGCAGTIRLSAQLGTSVRTEDIALPCGE
jgi:hypothetical protein